MSDEYSPSYNKVTVDAYYEAKVRSGLIGNQEEDTPDNVIDLDSYTGEAISE